ncbi:hypothetical protein AB0I84_08090 [Streptomyces spectabilis]|uniref:hypothetical protein n=1 Tax=Streptomyces spectabilis TaxID=68270 RepID=UPI0033D5B140
MDELELGAMLFMGAAMNGEPFAVALVSALGLSLLVLVALVVSLIGGRWRDRG